MNISKWLLTAAAILSFSGAAHAQYLQNWSQTPASNNAAAPNGWPTGMSPADVKLSGRQMMSAVRTWYDDAQWIDPGYSLAASTTTAFIVSDTNSGIYHANRRVKIYSGGSYQYGTISSTSYSAPSTTVLLNLDNGTISTTSLSRVWYGAVGAQNSSVTSTTLGLNNPSYYNLGNVPTQLTSVSNTGSISLTNLTIGSTGVVSGALTLSGTNVNALNVSGTNINVKTLTATAATGTVTATNVYATNVSATNLVVGGSTIAQAGVAKAWVKFAGASGTKADGYNVSSVTKNSTGSYTVNFTNAMSNSDYVVVMTPTSPGAINFSYGVASQSTSSFTIEYYRNGVATDPTNLYVAVLSN